MYLFGQVPVTQSDIDLWIKLTPRLHGLADFRVRHYIESYRVIEKIQRAKMAGCWPPADYSACSPPSSV